jgi:hypothetical protein
MLTILDTWDKNLPYGDYSFQNKMRARNSRRGQACDTSYCTQRDGHVMTVLLCDERR